MTEYLAIMDEVSADFWPKPVSHLAEPYLSAADEHAVIAEISDADINGYRGMRQVYSCLVPHDETDAILAAVGGIGSKVESWGPHPIVEPGGRWDGSFWVNGRHGENSKYEALAHGWDNHNRMVMVPDNGFLMCYGLVPRMLDSARLVWDDPKKPVYDVVEVRPLSIYEVPSKYSPASIRVRRDYLEDYASLKGCAAVAVYYEERYSRGDAQIAKVLGDQEGAEFALPGRSICVRRIDSEHGRGDDQLTQVWGCRLILKPAGRPISDEEDPDLVWPGGRRFKEFRPLEHVFVRDEVLREWESRSEFSVYPDSGDVSYGGWWSTSRSRRIGRHHIGVELAKLYEGTPPYVIRHFHRFAVAKEQVTRDCKEYGERHIGQRAAEVIDALFNLVTTLVSLSDRLGESYDEEEFVGITRQHVHYHGWWTLDSLKNLGHVVPLALTQDAFLGRCMDLHQLLERLKPGPIKRILIAMGLSADDVRKLGDVGALRYLATLCQLAQIAQQNGYGLLSDFAAIRQLWDKDRRLDLVAPLFALTSLRISHGHVQGADASKKLGDALRVFGLDAQAMKGGWGLGLDAVYDVLIRALNGMSQLIGAATA